MARQATPDTAASLPRRDLILSASAELFARRGVAAATMRDIAEATGLLAGSLYHHFESKDAIVDAILSRSLDRLLDLYREVQRDVSGPDRQLDGLIRASFRSIAEDPEASLIYLRDRELLLQTPRFAYLEATRAQVDDIWLGVLRAGQDAGVFRADIEPQIFYRYAASALWWAAGWQRVVEQSVDALADEYAAIFLDAIRAKPRRSNAR